MTFDHFIVSSLGVVELRIFNHHRLLHSLCPPRSARPASLQVFRSFVSFLISLGFLYSFLDGRRDLQVDETCPTGRFSFWKKATVDFWSHFLFSFSWTLLHLLGLSCLFALAFLHTVSELALSVHTPLFPELQAVSGNTH